MNDREENKITRFQKEYDKLLKKYNLGHVINPIIGFDLIALMANFSEREVRRRAKDSDFPPIYQMSYKNKGCKLHDVQQWIDSHKI
ncbi:MULTISPECIES: hypothetical protein [Commensalibacter]|uniref:hypothetical protein n=1 Tax=Commensalibacter TaxID=1079922 RepID=UPI0012D8E0CF|nr:MULTISPECIES: hypothetical protein [Commensalibacter]MBI0180014.1 hypothetical protein [Commensalibacter sp. W8163]MUH05373.1 hypothetical protein [Commensalibacter melissae]